MQNQYPLNYEWKIKNHQKYQKQIVSCLKFWWHQLTAYIKINYRHRKRRTKKKKNICIFNNIKQRIKIELNIQCRKFTYLVVKFSFNCLSQLLEFSSEFRLCYKCGYLFFLTKPLNAFLLPIPLRQIFSFFMAIICHDEIFRYT